VGLHVEAFVRNSGALPKGGQKNLKNRSFTWVRTFLLTIRQIEGELAVFCNPGARGNWAVFAPAALRACGAQRRRRCTGSGL